MADENAAPMAALQMPISLPPPPRFNFENPGEWPQWILQFDDYSFASGLYRAADENTDVAKFVRVVLNGHDGFFKVDTGAAVTVVSKEFPGVPKKLRRPDQVLTGPCNTRLDVLGCSRQL
ncbi:hypothetical protein MTO96_011460 [Rhipicephalus appendiculatus]